ncbi:MAG: retropepsin-like domain-containing protein [Tannerella sp.]|nr:retropepsin-like domain-containing protein [Tannerella sp.]
MKNLIYTGLMILAFLSCNNRQNNATGNVINEAIDTILSFDYRTPVNVSPGGFLVFEGTINDSIQLDILFDTGCAYREILVSDSLKNILNADSGSVQIEKYKKEMGIQHVDFPAFYNMFGKNTAVVGWTFFENKIIAISYQNRHVKILDKTDPNPDSIKVNRRQYRDGVYLTIPVKFHIQGKVIVKEVILDTGFNGTFMVPYDWAEQNHIKTESIVHSLSSNLMQYFVSSDSVTIGNLNQYDVPVHFAKVSFAGLIGNAVLEKYDIMLDLKNYYLYLKPDK